MAALFEKTLGVVFSIGEQIRVSIRYYFDVVMLCFEGEEGPGCRPMPTDNKKARITHHKALVIMEIFTKLSRDLHHLATPPQV